MEIHQPGVMETLFQEFNCSESTNVFKFDPKPNPYLPKSKPTSSVESLSSGVDSPDDIFDAGLRFISQVLLEEDDLEHKPCMFQECLALQAAEKSFYAVIGENYPPIVESEECPLGVYQDSDSLSENFETPFLTPSEFSNYDLDKVVVDPRESSGGKRNHHLDDRDYLESGRSNKQLAANYVEESDEQLLIYDKALLCSDLNPHLHQLPNDDPSNNRSKIKVKRSSGGRPRKNQKNRKEVIDLSTLLTQCAQAVARNDGRNVNELLKRIRQHSSPHGDGSERLAHYLANALEQRLAGEGTGASLITSGVSAKDILKGYQVYLEACPFNKLSMYYANNKIFKLSKRSTTLHIIDFGILYGFQWPCLIQLLSLEPGGAPKLRITGIDLPQPGLRPAERLEETGRRLKDYCERFNVPFEYTAIATKWDSIQLEDIKFEKDEIVVVNCLFRLRNVPDDSVVASNPRDKVLSLIRQINPDLFVHGVVNGTYNTAFFLTRFRETFFFYSGIFDMFDATVDREDQDRMLYEREVFGKNVMNVIACEGTERFERPESYKQWQVRNERAGFRQAKLDKEIVGKVREKMQQRYHKDFVVDEDGKWLLQGWKGRITCAISCWKPARDIY